MCLFRGIFTAEDAMHWWLTDIQLFINTVHVELFCHQAGNKWPMPSYFCVSFRYFHDHIFRCVNWSMINWLLKMPLVCYTNRLQHLTDPSLTSQTRHGKSLQCKPKCWPGLACVGSRCSGCNHRSVSSLQQWEVQESRLAGIQRHGGQQAQLQNPKQRRQEHQRQHIHQHQCQHHFQHKNRHRHAAVVYHRLRPKRALGILQAPRHPGASLLQRDPVASAETQFRRNVRLHGTLVSGLHLREGNGPHHHPLRQAQFHLLLRPPREADWPGTSLCSRHPQKLARSEDGVPGSTASRATNCWIHICPFN